MTLSLAGLSIVEPFFGKRLELSETSDFQFTKLWKPFLIATAEGLSLIELSICFYLF